MGGVYYQGFCIVTAHMLTTTHMIAFPLMEGVWNRCTHRKVAILGSVLGRYVGNLIWREHLRVCESRWESNWVS